jgi:hypothetical protein
VARCQNIEAEAAQFLKPAPEDYFVFEPTVIARNPSPPKPKAQLSLLQSSLSLTGAD